MRFKPVLRSLLICSEFSSTTGDAKWWLDNFDILIKCPKVDGKKGNNCLAHTPWPSLNTKSPCDSCIIPRSPQESKHEGKTNHEMSQGVNPTCPFQLRDPECFPYVGLNDATEEEKVAHLKSGIETNLGRLRGQTPLVTWSPLHQRILFKAWFTSFTSKKSHQKKQRVLRKWSTYHPSTLPLPGLDVFSIKKFTSHYKNPWKSAGNTGQAPGSTLRFVKPASWTKTVLVWPVWKHQNLASLSRISTFCIYLLPKNSMVLNLII